MNKKLAKEILLSVVVAIATTTVVGIWLVWPSFSSAAEDENIYIPAAKTVCITHTVTTGESVTSIAKKIIDENHLDINPDVFASVICTDNNIRATDYIHEGDVLYISFSVKEETGN